MVKIRRSSPVFVLVFGLVMLFSGCFSGCIDRKNIINTDPRVVSRLELGLLVKSVAQDYFSLPGEIEGRALLVTKVKQDSYARAMGIQPDDLIYKINGQRVTGMADSYDVMHKVKDMPALQVELLRGGKKMTLSLDLKKG